MSQLWRWFIYGILERRPPARYLFLSFSELLARFPYELNGSEESGRKVLREALFYLDVPREDGLSQILAFDYLQSFEQAHGKFPNGNDLVSMAMRYHMAILPGLLRAQEVGRVLWRGEKQSFTELDKFLREWGYPPLSSEFMEEKYSGVALEEYIRRKNFPDPVFDLTVVA